MAQITDEINSVEIDHPSTWLEVLKKSAISVVREDDCSLLNDDVAYCELPETEHEKFKSEIKDEAVFHDQWDEIDLERRVVRHSVQYVEAWNSIIAILIKYGIDRISKKWFMEPTDAEVYINKFCSYDLPADAVVGGEWELPEWYINDVDDINAPFWDFEFPGFDGFIRSVKKTDKEDILEVEYWIYKRDIAHCNGYYQHCDSGKAMVDISTHRRWMIEQ